MGMKLGLSYYGKKTYRSCMTTGWWEEYGRKWHETGQNCVRRFINITLQQCYYGDHATEDKIHGTCSMHGRSEKCIQNVGRKTWRE